MDFIRKYDIELEKELYYAGELLRGWVVIENAENLRLTGIQVYLRGKAHVEWRITRGGERRTVKEDQYFIDDKLTVWGKASEADEGNAIGISILEHGEHRMPFEFTLPADHCIPCSFESRVGTIRYYLRVIVDIPYASQPQGLKYFTVIGQQVDCLDEKYLVPISASRQQSSKCALCTCTSGALSLDACLERTAYCCNEYIRLKCDVTNGTDQDVTLSCRLIQNVEYRINKGPMGFNKDVTHHVLEYRSPIISPHSVKSFHELHHDLQVPRMPPTLTDVCRLIDIHYLLRVFVHMEKSNEDLILDFPFIVATVPFRERGASHLPEVTFEPADYHVEGGIYISPEFQLGQVYDGAADVMEDVILYRPVYICLAHSPSNSELGNGRSSTVREPLTAAGLDEQTKSCSATTEARRHMSATINSATTIAGAQENSNGRNSPSSSSSNKTKKALRQKSTTSSSNQAPDTPVMTSSSPASQTHDQPHHLAAASVSVSSSQESRPSPRRHDSPAATANNVSSPMISPAETPAQSTMSVGSTSFEEKSHRVSDKNALVTASPVSRPTSDVTISHVVTSQDGECCSAETNEDLSTSSRVNHSAPSVTTTRT